MYTLRDMPDITAICKDRAACEQLGLHVSLALLSANEDDREQAKERLRRHYPYLRSAFVADNLIMVRYRIGDDIRTYWAAELQQNYRNDPKSVHPFVLCERFLREPSGPKQPL